MIPCRTLSDIFLLSDWQMGIQHKIGLHRHHALKILMFSASSNGSSTIELKKRGDSRWYSGCIRGNHKTTLPKTEGFAGKSQHCEYVFFLVCVCGIVISSGFGHLWCQCTGWHTIQSHFRGWHLPTQGPNIGSFSFYCCWIPIKQKHVEWTNII